MTRQERQPDATRDALIAAVLAHVAFDGWGDKALLAAAEECAIAGATAQSAFPRGAASLIVYHAAQMDRCMEAGLAGETLKSLGVRGRIAAAVRLRLELEQPHREAVRAAMAYCARPFNAQLSLGCLYHTVDSLWFAIGDTSTDFNFYSKRALLAGAYGATLLYWLDDGSEDQGESWDFLDRRLEDVMRVGRLKGNLQRILPTPETIAQLVRGRRAGGY